MRISDWSSDVCSSDLAVLSTPKADVLLGRKNGRLKLTGVVTCRSGSSNFGHRLTYESLTCRNPRAPGAALWGFVLWWILASLGRGASLMTISSEEPTSELQSLMRISYDDFCLKKK